ncbi:type IX secretion system anionic LPS delivery protein PorZ [Wenyingzhuangia sp. IMCC45467]
MKYIYLYLLLSFQLVMSQKDYANQWKDMYSYNDVKDFTIINNNLYAITENSMFVYDINSDDVKKISSVNGLSGTTTSSISFDESTENIIIGYESGLIEIIDTDNNVVPITGIKNNLILVNKIVKGVYSSQNQSYAFGDFGIVEINLNNLEFGDIYKLSNGSSSSYSVNKMIIENNIIYAATNNGLYAVDASLNPIDFNNWNQISSGNITNLISLKGEIYFTKDTGVYEITNPSVAVITTTANILNLNIIISTDELVLTTSNFVDVYETSTFTKTDQVNFSTATNYTFTTTKAIVNNNEIFVNTSNYGVLKTVLSDKVNYVELHPDGPSANDIFGVTISGNQKWVVYGGFNPSYNGLNRYRGVDYYVDGKWNYLKNNQIDRKKDYLKIIVDPFDSSKVLIASLRDGVTELNDFNFVKRWVKTNTNDILPGHLTTGEAFVGSMVIDKNNMIWTANSRAKDNNFFSKYNGEKTDADRWELKITFPDIGGSEGYVRGFNKMYVDHNNNVYAATARTGLFVFNANSVSDENDRQITVLNDSANNGQLNSNYVSSVVADENNRIWIGTSVGLLVFDDYDNLYNTTKRPATTLIIEENGAARELLANTQVNDIIIDLAGNKWFATEGAGVLQTSSDGQTTYNIFNTSNSPLPDNTVIDLELDEITGEIYMVTEKGMLSYDGKNEPFGTEISDVIAYPNPAIRNQIGHENITIVAKDGNGIPDGTNVKIMDVSGKLVYETNVNSANGSLGGKVVWDKTNLRGNFVVSGVYIVLLSSADGSETTTTKIAVVN